MPRREQGFVTNLIQGVVIGVVLTSLSYAVGLGMDWIESLDWLEAFAVFTSYVSTFLFVVERRMCYVWGAISTVAYCVLFYRFDLNASMAINAFLSVYLIYGFLRWRRDDNTLPITRMGPVDWVVALLVTAAGYFVAVMLSTTFGGAMVWTDAVILVGTLLAQWLLDNKKAASWLIWVVVNVFAIYTYATTGLALVALQYVAFLFNALWAWRVWVREMNRPVDQSTPAIATS